MDTEGSNERAAGPLLNKYLRNIHQTKQSSPHCSYLVVNSLKNSIFDFYGCDIVTWNIT